MTKQVPERERAMGEPELRAAEDGMSQVRPRLRRNSPERAPRPRGRRVGAVKVLGGWAVSGSRREQTPSRKVWTPRCNVSRMVFWKT